MSLILWIPIVWRPILVLSSTRQFTGCANGLGYRLCFSAWFPFKTPPNSPPMTMSSHQAMLLSCVWRTENVWRSVSSIMKFKCSTNSRIYNWTCRRSLPIWICDHIARWVYNSCVVFSQPDWQSVVYLHYPWMSWTIERPYYLLYRKRNNTNATAAYGNRRFFCGICLGCMEPSCRAPQRPPRFLCMCGGDSSFTPSKSCLTLHTRKKIPFWISLLSKPQQQWKSSIACLRIFISYRGTSSISGREFSIS